MPSADSGLLIPDWSLPAGVGAVITTRLGGVSISPYEHNNLALHVGDDPSLVRRNRQHLWQQLPGVQGIQWLSQVHGTDVIKACGGAVVPQADAQFSDTPGLACAILTADCLPVLFCATDGSQVAAAHAGWRGLAAGVLLNTLATFPDPSAVRVYLGPAIGPEAFEVGPEVREAFAWAPDHCFHAGRGDRLMADIYALAQLQLLRAGVAEVAGGGFCTLSDERFYSYRRQSQTGRMASLIWIRT